MYRYRKTSFSIWLMPLDFHAPSHITHIWTNNATAAWQRQRQRDDSLLSSPPELYWWRPSNTITTAENGRRKHWTRQEIASCSRLNYGGGLKAVAEDGKIGSKKKAMFLRKWGHSQSHCARIYQFLFCYTFIFVVLPTGLDYIKG